MEVKTIQVLNWNAFEEALREVSEFHEPRGQKILPLLFRGQSDSSWTLDTSLERANKKNMRFDRYYSIISQMRSEIEAFTGQSWKIPDYSAVNKLVGDYDPMNRAMWTGDLPAYGYMAHLRHYGFPSPLLDWSRSPYIAAFFAFRHARPNECVSVYALSESTRKSGSSAVPRVQQFGPLVQTHKRHFLQQCSYTICLSYTEQQWRLVPHESRYAFSGPPPVELPNFDVWKFDIPMYERLNFLGRLDRFNLNAFSLFGSEETLYETMASRLLELGD